MILEGFPASVNLWSYDLCGPIAVPMQPQGVVGFSSETEGVGRLSLRHLAGGLLEIPLFHSHPRQWEVPGCGSSVVLRSLQDSILITSSGVLLKGISSSHMYPTRLKNQEKVTLFPVPKYCIHLQIYVQRTATPCSGGDSVALYLMVCSALSFCMLHTCFPAL